MITVNFQNRFGVTKPMTTVEDLKAAWNYIESYLKKVNYDVYYYRTWDETPTTRMIDFGSHSEFFQLENTEPWQEP